ncbi:MAG: fumarylacetoacetate hydrolase family protein, partial [Gemmobacter sp.]|nr:fumarylacetoacetate hydrolase family protein [Gemmobacter sp.]
TRDMLFSFEEILAHITQDEWIHPGEFMGSGTVGNGCGVENGWFLSDGDTIELEVEKIGVLRTTVSAAKSV